MHHKYTVDNKKDLPVPANKLAKQIGWNHRRGCDAEGCASYPDGRYLHNLLLNFLP